MSHFYLYPLLLSQGYSPLQIQQILHSFGFFANPLFQENHYPFFTFQNPNDSLLSYNSRNFIIQSNNNSSFESNKGSSGDSSDSLQNEKKSPQKQNNVKLQPLEILQNIQQNSFDQVQIQEQRTTNNGAKTRRKKKLKKMTLKEKRQKQMKRNQTENSKRNIIPNQIHQMLSILFKKKKSTRLVDKLILKFSSNHPQISISNRRFYLYQSLLKEKINHYANEQTLKVLLVPLEPSFKIYPQDEQRIYCKMGLILIDYFLNNQAALIILNSQRIKLENKLDHLKTKRYLSYVLKEIIHLEHQSSQIKFL